MTFLREGQQRELRELRELREVREQAPLASVYQTPDLCALYEVRTHFTEIQLLSAVKVLLLLLPLVAVLLEKATTNPVRYLLKYGLRNAGSGPHSSTHAAERGALLAAVLQMLHSAGADWRR